MILRRMLLAFPLLAGLTLPFAALAADRGGVDVEALARIRPGMPAAVLQAALGRHWREPPPDRFVWQDGTLDTHHSTRGMKVWVWTDADLDTPAFQ